MSFLLETEEQATLDEALAFIDAFARELEEEGGGGSISGSGSDSPLYVELRIPQLAHSNTSSSAPKSSTESGGNSGSDDAIDRDQRKTLSKCRASNTRAVNRYRKRNKSEIIELRNKVEELNMQLAKLHRHRNEPFGGSNATSTFTLGRRGASLQLQTGSQVGFEDVLLEYRKLQESEALNRKLKDALAKQRSISSTLASVFQKAISKKDLSFVWDIESRLQKKAKLSQELVTQDSSSAKVYSELFQYLKEVVYDNTAAILHQLNKCDTDCVFSNKMIKHDRTVGKMLELTSNIPLLCSLDQLDALIWANLVNPNDNTKVVEFSAQSGAGYDAGCERSYTTTFTGSLGHVQVNGVTAIHRFVEPHRIVFAYTSLLVPVESSDLRLRESGWLIISDSHVSGCPSVPALFQTVYRLHAERQSTVPRSTESLALLDFVMKAQSEKMRACHDTIHNLLEHQLKWVAEPERLSTSLQQGLHAAPAATVEGKCTDTHLSDADSRYHSSTQNEWLQILLCGSHAVQATTGLDSHAYM